MEYLGRRLEARLDPSQVFPGARSVLCVALQYHPLDREDGERQPEPRGISGAGWPAMPAGGTTTRSWASGCRPSRRASARRSPAARRRRYVDTGPVLERELAARAGMGAVGKNTMLLHPEGGSWFLLGELFLSLDLDAGPAARRSLRELHPLPGRLPDRRARRALPAGQQPLHHLLDDRAPRAAARRRRGGWWGAGSSAATSARRSAPGTRRRPAAVHPEMELPPERGGADPGAAAAPPARGVRRALPREPDEAGQAGGAAAERRRGDGESAGVPLRSDLSRKLCEKGSPWCAATRPGRWGGSGARRPARPWRRRSPPRRTRRADGDPGGDRLPRLTPHPPRPILEGPSSQ